MSALDRRYSRPWSTPLGLMLAFATTSLAHAYQTVKVGPSGASVFVNPASDSATTATLAPGQTVNIGDQAKNGFYRASAAKGVTGWVQEDSLIVVKRPGPSVKGETAVAHANAAPVLSANGAGDFRRISVGPMVGIGIAGGGSSLTFGLEGRYRPSPTLGIGLYFTYLSLASAATSTTNAAGVSSSISGGASLMVIAGELNYYVPQIPGFFVGGKVGVGLASANATSAAVTANGVTVANSVSASASTTAIGFAAAAGYDYQVLPELSVGGEGNAFFMTGGFASSIINVFLTAKYHL